ncbi:MAG TPA: hypothetical protein VEY91_05370 [Candidatus Limnocylindria bacterium]|nr:hypothetical protein [Candidatus Limnocylindria bacterium]
MKREELEKLVEAAATAYRETGPDGTIRPASAWWDIPAEDRQRVYELQSAYRRLERARHPLGWSSTVQAVLRRIQ